jgi:hypothetical protein
MLHVYGLTLSRLAISSITKQLSMALAAGVMLTRDAGFDALTSGEIDALRDDSVLP